jgi:hypothetical protein
MNGTVIQKCDAASLCSTLRHDWLDHQIIRPLRAEKAKWMSVAGDRTLPLFFRSLGAWVREVRTFADDAVEGFSPRQLVDAGPLGQLSEGVRSLVKDGVHQAYLDQQLVQPLVEQLRKVTDSFEAAAEGFVGAWTCDAAERGRAIEQFEASAVCLRDMLGRFPCGVVLW